MKPFLVLVLVGMASAAVVPAGDKYANRAWHYHRNFGIKEAARIKAAEEAIDFTGARIVGGSNATLGQFPHMGGLLIILNKGISVCGSSMLTNTRAVTAAHCWDDGDTRGLRLTIVYGSLTLFSGGTRVTSSDVVIHPDWNPSSMQNDVAVIRHAHVKYTLNIHPIALASSTNLFVNVLAQTAGFGRQAHDVPVLPNQQLHYVHLHVITNEECARTFNNLPASNICTSGFGGRSACIGDSGGPLTFERRLIGIMSFNHDEGCLLGHPAVYARVTSYSSWIAARF